MIKVNDMENQSSSIESLIDRVKSYAETRIDLLKLKAIDKSSSFLSTLVTMIVLGMVGLIFIILLNIGLALYIGSLVGNAYYGFFIVAGFYLIAGLVIFVCRDKWLKTPVSNVMIKNLLD